MLKYLIFALMLLKIEIASTAQAKSHQSQVKLTSIEGQQTGESDESQVTLTSDEPQDDSENKENEGNTNKEKKDPEPAPPKIGNFSLPTSHQPAGLFAFGGNVISKGEVQLYLFADIFKGRKRVISDVLPGVLFGVTDNWSLFFNFPFTPIMRDGNQFSSGLEDFFVQGEYAFYNKLTYEYADQATLVANITVPTGSARKDPPTGYGSPSFFLGATYYHVYVDWIMFTCQGAILTTSDNRTKIGDQFMYQFGIGRNIPSPCGWIYAWMLEVDGQYNQKNRFGRHYDLNSGGNIIFVTPSLWVSSKEVLVQFGVTFPVSQNLFGNQRKFDYGFNFNFAWSFY